MDDITLLELTEDQARFLRSVVLQEKRKRERSAKNVKRHEKFLQAQANRPDMRNIDEWRIARAEEVLAKLPEFQK